MRASRWSAILACVSLFLAAPAAAQNVKSGIDAWQRGDYVGAVAIWRPLAQAGDADASFNLGQAYRLGRGVLVDLGTAQTWLERAAEKDHVDAQTTLGLLLFQNGNQADGLRWLKRASEGGDARAMLVYGTALFNGDSVPQDPVLGYAYVSRAAAQGLEPARNTLAQMDEIMPLAQRKKGVALATQKAKTPPSPRTDRTKVAAAQAKPKPEPKSTGSSPPTAAGGAWRIQLGAFSQRSSAEALYRRLSGSAPVAGRRLFLVPAGAVTRLQVGPYPSKGAAAAACSTLAARGIACFPVAAK
jgi:cell division septation protein DedD